MQVIAKIIIVPMLLFILQSDKCKQDNISLENNSNSNQIINRNEATKKQPLKVAYKTLTKECASAVCLAFIYVKKELCNEINLKQLSSFLNDKYSDKEKVIVVIFDNLKLAEAHAQGKREPLDMEQTAKGLFLRDKKEEYLKIRVSKKESEDWSSWKIIYEKKF
jgi:hypothetical protein